MWFTLDLFQNSDMVMFLCILKQGYPDGYMSIFMRIKMEKKNNKRFPNVVGSRPAQCFPAFLAENKFRILNFVWSG